MTDDMTVREQLWAAVIDGDEYLAVLTTDVGDGVVR